MSDYQVICQFGTPARQVNGLRLVDFAIEQAINDIPLATLEFDAGKMTELQPQIADTRLGVDVVIEIAGQEVFNGTVTEQSILRVEGAWRVRIRARHILFMLTLGSKSRVFKGASSTQTIADNVILKQVLNDRLGVTTKGSVSGMTGQHMQLVQHGTTDWQFVRSRVLANRAWLVPTLTGYRIELPLVATPVTKPQDIAAVFTSGDADGLQSAVWRYSAECLDYVEVAAWDIDQQRLGTAQSGSQLKLGLGAFDTNSFPELSEYKLTINRSAPLHPTTCAGLADGLQLQRQLHAAQGSFMLEGSAATLNYQLGKMVSLKNFGPRLNGSAPITSIRHVGGDSGWQTVVGVGLEMPLLDYAHGKSQGSTVHTGVVQAYPPQQDKHFRVLVKVPALLEDQSLWARLASPFASKGEGMAVFPNPGDEVLLQFIDGDLSYPVIIGSLYSASRSVPAAYQPKGSQPFARGVLVSDEGELQIAAAGSLLKSDKGELTLDSAKALQLQSQTKNIVLSGQTGVGLQAKGGPIELSAGTQLKLTAKAKAEMSAAAIAFTQNTSG